MKQTTRRKLLEKLRRVEAEKAAVQAENDALRDQWGKRWEDAKAAYARSMEVMGAQNEKLEEQAKKIELLTVGVELQDEQINEARELGSRYRVVKCSSCDDGCDVCGHLGAHLLKLTGEGS